MYLGEGTTVATPVRVGTVAYEAERLDRLFPGWYLTINTETLSMGDGLLCVLGQGVPDSYYCFTSGQVQEDVVSRGEPYATIVAMYVWDRFIPEWTQEIESRRASMS